MLFNVLIVFTYTDKPTHTQTDQSLYLLWSIGPIKIFCCPSVRGGCGRGRSEFVGRVQNHHVRFSFHRNGHNIS